jgi:hypothetical protein
MNDTKLLEDSATRRPPAAGMGRPKGALNKTTKAAKDAIAQAAEELGGVDRLVAWTREDPANERVFWGTIYPKLLPLQLTGEGGGPIEVKEIKINLVRPSGD